MKEKAVIRPRDGILLAIPLVLFALRSTLAALIKAHDYVSLAFIVALVVVFNVVVWYGIFAVLVRTLRRRQPK